VTTRSEQIVFVGEQITIPVSLPPTQQPNICHSKMYMLAI